MPPWRRCSRLPGVLCRWQRDRRDALTWQGAERSPCRQGATRAAQGPDPGLCLPSPQVRPHVTDFADPLLADPVGVPAGASQQMLHAIRRGIAAVLGERPAVLPRQIREQPEPEGTHPTPHFHPAESAGDPIQQLIDPGLPGGRSYPDTRGHRGLCRSPHT